MRMRFSVVALAAALISGCATSPDRTFRDPEYGVWNFYETVVDNAHTDQNLEYVARNGNTINKLYATTGFYNGVAIVAYCHLIKNDRTCAEWDYYQINPNGEIVADFSNYVLPTLTLCSRGYPSTIYLSDRSFANGEKYDFPLWKTKGNGCAEKVLSSSPAFYQDRILVFDKTAQRFGFFDLQGNLVIPPTLKMATSFYKNGYAYVVNEDNIAGTITTDGTFTPFNPACKTKVADGMYQVSRTGAIYNYSIDSNLNDGTYYFISEVDQKNMSNCPNSKVGIVDKDNNVIVPIQYDSVLWSADTPYILVTEGTVQIRYTKYGKGLFLDRMNKQEIPGRHFFLMQDDKNKWAIGSPDGEYYASYIYDDVRYSTISTDIGTYAISKYIGVRDGYYFGIMGPNGQVLIAPKYEDLTPAGNDLFITKVKNKYGVFYNGLELYEPVFDSIDQFRDGKALARMDGREYQLFLDREEERQYYEKIRQERPPRGHFGPPRHHNER